MKKILRILAVSVLGIFLLAVPALAAPFSFGDGGVQLQTVLNNITSPYPGVSSVNVTTDAINSDAYWSIGGSGGSVNTMVVALGSFAPGNIFGVYSGANYVPIFNGVNTPGTQALLSILGDGSVIVNFVDTGVDFAGNNFGYYLDSRGPGGANGGLFRSDTSLNIDGLDHMATYQGKGDLVKIGNRAEGTWSADEYILAFEDLNNITGSDRNYTDLVVMVESVAPVPEPSTLLLIGLGLLGVGIIKRKS